MVSLLWWPWSWSYSPAEEEDRNHCPSRTHRRGPVHWHDCCLNLGLRLRLVHPAHTQTRSMGPASCLTSVQWPFLASRFAALFDSSLKDGVSVPNWLFEWHAFTVSRIPVDSKELANKVRINAIVKVCHEINSVYLVWWQYQTYSESAKFLSLLVLMMLHAVLECHSL
jgi:hypothetical protein